VNTGYKFALLAENIEYGLAHAGHKTHINHNIFGIGNFYTDLSNLRTERTHAERDHVHSTAFHTTFEFGQQDRFHLGRIHPVIRRTGSFFGFGANKSSVLNPGNVAGV